MKRVVIGYAKLNKGGVAVFCDLAGWDERHLRARAASYDGIFYTRLATQEEVDYFAMCRRVRWYKANSAEQLIESEKEILGEDSEEFRKLRKAVIAAGIRPAKRSLQLFNQSLEANSIGEVIETA